MDDVATVLEIAQATNGGLDGIGIWGITDIGPYVDELSTTARACGLRPRLVTVFDSTAPVISSTHSRGIDHPDITIEPGLQGIADLATLVRPGDVLIFAAHDLANGRGAMSAAPLAEALAEGALSSIPIIVVGNEDRVPPPLLSVLVHREVDEAGITPLSVTPRRDRRALRHRPLSRALSRRRAEVWSFITNDPMGALRDGPGPFAHLSSVAWPTPQRFEMAALLLAGGDLLHRDVDALVNGTIGPLRANHLARFVSENSATIRAPWDVSALNARQDPYRSRLLEHTLRNSHATGGHSAHSL